MPRATAIRLPGLLRERTRALLTQDELARRAGITRMVISRAERGEVCRLSTVRKLAGALRVEPSALTN